VLAHVALAAVYGAIIPPWEAHDETGHFAYVNHVVNTRTLPDAVSQDKALFDQSHQPPLYYLVASALTFWVDRSDDVRPEFNNFALDGTNRRGFRIMLRQPGEAFPWAGTILALHTARVVSALLAGLTIYLIARSANLLFGQSSSAALLSAAIAAFNPQVLFMGAMVNNDVMVAVMGALVAYCVLRVASTSSHESRVTSYLLLGLALGLAFLSKNSALALIGFVVLALIFIAWRQRWAIRDLIVRGAITFAAFAMVAVPYLIYNVFRYGRLLIDRNPNNPILAAPTSLIGEGVLVSIRDAWLPQLFANTFRTFWGKFGWGNVSLPEWAYLAFAAFTLIGAIGCIIGYRRASCELRTGLIVLFMLGVSMMVLPLYRALSFHDPALLPGRYIMPALTAYACLLGFGWAMVVGHRSVVKWQTTARPSATTFLIAVLATFALVTPVAYIWPHYAPNRIASNTSSVSPALLTFGDLVQLTDAAAHTTLLPDREGKRPYARVRLAWRAMKPTDQQVAFGVSVLGRDNEVLGTMNVYPNRGNYPATGWRAGDTFVDDYDILLEKPCARLPALGKLNISVFQFDWLTDTRQISVTHRLPALDGEGREVTPLVGRFKVDAAPPMAVFWQPGLASFDGVWLREIQLPREVTPGSTVTATLTYEMVQPNHKRGTAFLHLLDANGKSVTQDDHEPLGGNYPTDMWDAGECVHESFTLQIPPEAKGALRAVTGFYAADGMRFKTGTQDDIVHLGDVKVTTDE
jgi:4-amino-4-deoxy-L-arabinose transferase-like glycosyltransferase